MERAVRGGRVLITEDKDFGQLVYAKMQKTGGVIFIRFPARVRRSLPATVVEVVRRRGQRLIGSFTVPYNQGECALGHVLEAEGGWLGVRSNRRRVGPAQVSLNEEIILHKTSANSCVSAVK